MTACRGRLAGAGEGVPGSGVEVFASAARGGQSGRMSEPIELSRTGVVVVSLSTAEVPGEVWIEIRQLLARAFAGRFSQEDWEHALGGFHVIVSDAGAVVSHAAVVPRTLEVARQPFNTGYVEGVATSPDRRGERLGSLAMDEIMRLIRDNFEMGALSTGRSGFYERLGWERWRGPTFVRDGKQETRTEQEDDGVMILRFGVSQDIDLTAPLSCEQRRGDNW